jgi:uncharacterized membrane protein YidH (DUF202 family)
VSRATPEHTGGPSFEDATRRTHLAEERTLLAWWRSGLAAMAVALGVGRILPAVTHDRAWPFITLGVGYALLAVMFVVFGTARHRAVDRALAAGRFEPLKPKIIVLITTLLLALTMGTALVVLLGA